MGAGKPFRVTRQNAAGENLHAPTYNACRCCHKPIPETKGVHYCSTDHESAHKRLTQPRTVFACTIDETAA